MQNQIPVYKITQIENPTFTPPTRKAVALLWFVPLPESPFGEDYWPIWAKGRWKWVSGPPLLDFGPVDRVENN